MTEQGQSTGPERGRRASDTLAGVRQAIQAALARSGQASTWAVLIGVLATVLAIVVLGAAFGFLPFPREGVPSRPERWWAIALALALIASAGSALTGLALGSLLTARWNDLWGDKRFTDERSAILFDTFAGHLSRSSAVGLAFGTLAVVALGGLSFLYLKQQEESHARITSHLITHSADILRAAGCDRREIQTDPNAASPCTELLRRIAASAGPGESVEPQAESSPAPRTTPGT